MLYIKKGVTLTVKGGDALGTEGAGAGIRVDPGQTLVITGPGTLNVSGGNGAAGIGGGCDGGCGTIVISGGDVTAYSLGSGSGIGDGASVVGGTVHGERRITISGGNVFATGGDSSPGIGGGIVAISGGTVFAMGGEGAPNDIGAGEDSYGVSSNLFNGGSIFVASGRVSPAASNATERVWLVTIPNLVPNAAVTNLEIVANGSGICNYGANDIFADENGKIYLWLPAGDYTITVNGNESTVTVNANDESGSGTGPDSLEIESIEVDGNRVTLVVSALPDGWLTAATAAQLRVRAGETLPLAGDDTALLPDADVAATLNPDGTVTLALPSTTASFFRVEVQ